MPSERVQRQIDRLLDEAEQAIRASDWALVRGRCEQVLRLDPGNADAAEYLAAAQRAPASQQEERPFSFPLPEGEGQGEGQPAPQRAPGQGVAHAGESPAEHPSSPALLAQGEKGVAPPASFANGRYQVKKFLGEGGKKKVYLAHDTLLDRDVAFALIKTDGLDEIGRDRITREAQAMGRLGTHPHIVSVFDLGEEPATSNEQRVRFLPLSRWERAGVRANHEPQHKPERRVGASPTS